MGFNSGFKGLNRRVTSELKDDTCRHHDDLVELYFPSSKKIMSAKEILFWDLPIVSVFWQCSNCRSALLLVKSTFSNSVPAVTCTERDPEFFPRTPYFAINYIHLSFASSRCHIPLFLPVGAFKDILVIPQGETKLTFENTWRVSYHMAVFEDIAKGWRTHSFWVIYNMSHAGWTT